MGRHTQIGGDFLEVFTLIGRVGLEGAGEVEDNLKNIEDGADNTSSKFENLMDKTDKLGRGMTKFVTGPIAAVATGIGALAYQAGQYADGILDTSSATGLATDTIQEYQAVAEVAGVNTEVLVRAQEMLTRQMARSEGGSARLTRAVENLSISYQELEDTSPEQRVMLLAEELGKIPDAAQRAETGMMLFGGAWRDLAPIVDLGTENIEKFRERAQEVGYVMSGEGLNAANDYRIELVLLRQQFTGMWRDLQQKIIPILNNDLLPTVRDELIPVFENFGNRVLDLVDWFADLDPEAQKFLSWAVGLSAVAGPLAIVLPQIVTSFQILFGALSAGVALLGPTGLVVGGILAMVAAFTDLDNKLFDVIGKYVELEKVSKSATEAELVSQLAEINMEINEKQMRLDEGASGIIASNLQNRINVLSSYKKEIMEVLNDLRSEETETQERQKSESGESVYEQLLKDLEERKGQEVNLTDTIEQELQSREDRFSNYQFKLAQLSREGWEAREAELKRQQEKELQITEDTFERNKEIMRENISAALSEDLDDDTLSQLQNEIVQVMEGGETEWDMPTGIDPELWSTITERFFNPALEEYEGYQEERRIITEYYNELIEQEEEDHQARKEEIRQQEIAAEKRKEDEIMQNRFEANDISEQEYRRYLRQRLDDFEEFSNEWERRRSQINMTLEAESDPNEFSRSLARLNRIGRQAASGGTGEETEEQEISGFLQGIQQAHKQTTEQIQTFWRDTGQLLYNETNNLFSQTLKDAENFKQHFDNFMDTMVDNALDQLARLATNWVFTKLAGQFGFSLGGEAVEMASGGKVTGAVNAVIGEGRDEEVVMPLNQGVFSELASSITQEMNAQGGAESGPTNINLYQIDGANEKAIVNGVSRNPEVVKRIVVESVKNNSEVREMLKRFI